MKKNQPNKLSLVAKVMMTFLAAFALFLTACQETVDPGDTIKPEAAFSYAAEELVVTFTNESKGASSYSWDFGNGETLETTDLAETPVITYAAEGNYTVKLAVTRDNGNTDEISRIITLRQTPVADFQFASVGRTTTFTNLSANSNTYEWNFGDGSALSTEKDPVHDYAANGTYSVNLIARNGGLSADTTIDVTVVGPTAAFDFAVADKVVTFTNNSTDATSYSWDFGDGNTSVEVSPVYTYADFGVYNVVLTATATDGAISKDSTDIVVAAPPVASFTYAGTGLAIDFTNTSVDAATYSWDFGDGAGTSTDMSPTYTYAAAGSYMVTLTAANQYGVEDVARMWFNVDAVGAPYATWKNGSIDDYGSGTLKQSNNDDWEDPSFWTGTLFSKAGGISSDGAYIPGTTTKTLAMKYEYGGDRGAYQEVAVEIGQSYTVTFDIAGDGGGTGNDLLNVYLVNSRVTSETDPALNNAYYHKVVNDAEMSGKSNFVTFTATFTADSNVLTFLLLETANSVSATTTWLDNITLTKN